MEEIKKLLGSDKLILGQEETLKAARAGNLKKVFLASNVTEKMKEDLEYYKSIVDFEIKELTKTNEEIGVFCKKPYSISILAELK